LPQLPARQAETAEKQAAELDVTVLQALLFVGVD
jgi:hypothetical protein